MAFEIVSVRRKSVSVVYTCINFVVLEVHLVNLTLSFCHVSSLTKVYVVRGYTEVIQN